MMSRIEEMRDTALAAGNELWREASLRTQEAREEWARRTNEARGEFTRKTTEAREELTRRAALARQPQPAGVNPPPLKLLLGELSSLGRRRRGWLADYTALRPQPVMLLPGFGAHPMRMQRMKGALKAAGHKP